MKRFKTKIETLHQQTFVNSIPPGEYDGIWSGYSLSFENAPFRYTIKTYDGMKGEKSVKIYVLENGGIEFEIPSR